MEFDSIYTVPATRVRGSLHFAKLLKACRASSGRSQASIAKEIGCSTGAIVLRENGQRNITVADAVRELEASGYDLVVMRSGQIVGPDAFRHPKA